MFCKNKELEKNNPDYKREKKLKSGDILASCKGFSKKKMVKKSYLGIYLYGINAKMIEKKVQT